jgi:hypothetical protein
MLVRPSLLGLAITTLHICAGNVGCVHFIFDTLNDEERRSKDGFAKEIE